MFNNFKEWSSLICMVIAFYIGWQLMETWELFFMTCALGFWFLGVVILAYLVFQEERN